MDESSKDVQDQMAKEIEKKVEKGVTVGITILIQVAIMFVISMIVLKFVWAWVVPDLFPGAVEEGLIAASLTWLASLKLAVLVGVLSGVYTTFNEAVQKSS
jgi:hypothetical protein